MTITRFTRTAPRRRASCLRCRLCGTGAGHCHHRQPGTVQQRRFRAAASGFPQRRPSTRSTSVRQPRPRSSPSPRAAAGARGFRRFAASDPGATIGTIGAPLMPGMSRSMTFTVDTATNRFFSFASMVVPSNDFFIGNDGAQRYQLFDDQGNLQIASITQRESRRVGCRLRGIRSGPRRPLSARTPLRGRPELRGRVQFRRVRGVQRIDYGGRQRLQQPACRGHRDLPHRLRSGCRARSRRPTR